MTIQFTINWIIVLICVIYFMFYQTLDNNLTPISTIEKITVHLLIIVLIMATILVAYGLVAFQNLF